MRQESGSRAGSGADSSETTPLLRAPQPGYGRTDPDAPAGSCNGSGSSSDDETAVGSDSDGGKSAPAREGIPELARKMPIIFLAVSVGTFLGAMDQLLTATIMPKIGSDLNSLNNTSWIATAYFLTLTSMQPLYGRLSDVFGRKECLLFAYTVFGLGCLWCGLARSMAELCIARAVAGIGGAGMFPVTSILMSDILPLSERAVWQGYMNIAFGVGSALGAPLGGIFSDTVGWRWAFAVQAPICAVAFGAVYSVLPWGLAPGAAPPAPGLPPPSLLARLRRIDFLGAGCLIVAVIGLLMAMDSGANRGWADPSTIASGCVSLPFFALFAVVETRIAAEPFAPSRLVLQPHLLATNIVMAFSQATAMASMFVVPMFFQAVAAYPASRAGLLMIPTSVACVAGSVVTGIAIRRTGRFRPIMSVTLAAAAFVVLPFMVVEALRGSAAGMSAALALAALLVIPTTTAGVVALLAAVDVADTGVVVACQYLFRSLGSSIGVALSAAVMQLALRARLAARLGGDVDDVDRARRIEERVRHSLEYIRELPPSVAAMVRLSYRDATAAACGPIAAFAALAFVASLFMKDISLKTKK